MQVCLLPSVPPTRYEGSCRDSLFSVGLQGVKEGDVERVKEAVWSTLETVAKCVCVCACVRTYVCACV